MSEPYDAPATPNPHEAPQASTAQDTTHHDDTPAAIAGTGGQSGGTGSHTGMTDGGSAGAGGAPALDR